MAGRPKASSDRAPLAAPRGPSGYDRAARPALELAERIAELPPRAPWAAALREAQASLDRFAEALREGRMPPAAVAPARLALALVIDAAARGNPGLPARDWAAGAHRLLFDGESMSAGRLRDFAARAEGAGPAYAEAAAFLRDCLARVEAGRAARSEPEADGVGGLLLLGTLAFAALVVAWMLHAEWSFHRETSRAFVAEALALGLDRDGAIPDLPARLDRMADAVRRVEASVEKAPVRLFAGPLGFDAVAAARAAQAGAVARHLPLALARAIDRTLAEEGDGLVLYDTLRAWEILSGGAPWNAWHLEGWLAARRDLLPDLAGLAPQARLLAPPDPAGLPPPDPDLLAQARQFATETPQADRAWIELLRSPELAGVPPWRPERVEGLAEVAVRRSGLPIGTPLPGAFTKAGWAVARDGAAAAAIDSARAASGRLLGVPAGEATEAAVLARLQAETVAAWQQLLGDLRVRPIDRPATGVLVSGLLARRDSPLALLLREAWREAGGTDRTRPQELQLRIAAALGPAIQYVEDGRIAEVSALFGSLNAALGARRGGEEILTERLLGFRERAASIAALRQAPPVVTRLVEDVLAQVSVESRDQIANPFTRAWQAQVFELCRSATEGRFPFDPEGADASPEEVAALLGPGGAIERFFLAEAEPYLDTGASPWRWKPEARFEGLSPESAALFERALFLRGALFGAGGAMGAEVTFAALAERGEAQLALGGASAAVDAQAGPVTLSWPGPDPGAGVALSFQPGGGGASIGAPGPWGLLRLLGGLRLRERDGGRRFLVDLRSDSGRIFLEMSFASPANPASALALARGFGCPAAL